MVTATIHSDLRIVIFKAIENITFQEIVSALKSSIEKDEWERGFSVIIDLRDMVVTIPYSAYEQLQSFIGTYDKCRNVKQAVLVGSHFEGKMCQEWSQMAQPKDLLYQDFLNLREAAQWLGMNYSKLESALEAVSV